MSCACTIFLNFFAMGEPCFEREIRGGWCKLHHFGIEGDIIILPAYFVCMYFWPFQRNLLVSHAIMNIFLIKKSQKIILKIRL